MSWLIHLLLAELRIKEYHPNISASHSERFGRTLYLEAQLIRCVLDCICFSPSSSETSFSSIVVTKCKSRIILFFLKKERREGRRVKGRNTGKVEMLWNLDGKLTVSSAWATYMYMIMPVSHFPATVDPSRHCQYFYLCCSLSIEWVSFYSVARDCMFNMGISVCTWLCYTRCLHGQYNEPFGITYFYFVDFPNCNSLSVHQKYSHGNHVICAIPWT